MTAATDLFVEEARSVSIGEAMGRLAIAGLYRGTHEWTGPCPQGRSGSQGKRADGFAINPGKNVWNCRPCGVGGKDAIGLGAHAMGLDLSRRGDFMAACEVVLGRAMPDGDEDEAARQERVARAEALRQANAKRAAKEAASNAEFREKERARARGKWEAAGPGDRAREYLARRLGVGRHDIPPLTFVRDIDSESYWHGRDARGHDIELHLGPAMVAPFVEPAGTVIGCHLTWIDLKQPPKLRPTILDEEGKPLPTKKMRGTKKGGLIPLYGWYWTGGRILPSDFANRFVSGEGIENTVAIALAEDFRPDTLYAAAGDLGNLAGPADPASTFPHPILTKADIKGRARPIRVQGPVPRANQGADDAMQVPDFITEILLVADGDSEPVFTASTMARAEARLARESRTAGTLWPVAGADFTTMFQGEPAS